MDIYLIAIGGTGMAPLACLLQELGHTVRGADGPLYPPMSTLLADAGIDPQVGFDPAHLDPEPDLVVVGNAVPRDNVEAVETERRGLERLSMPRALARFCLAGRRPLVVAGTHGKTTTTSMAAVVYDACGADPGYLIGGVPHGLPSSFRLGGGARFLVEGDEYNAAYFDREAKFLHYRAETLILTSAEYDHADLYPEPEALTAAYAKLIAGLPADGLLVACGDSPEVRELARAAPCRRLLYGLEPANDVRPLDGVAAGADASRFHVAAPGGEAVEIALPVAGAHNVANALAVIAAAFDDGLEPAAVARALSGFGGVKRRLDLIAEVAGVTVVEDFAHHPTAVAATLAALRQSHAGRRLVAAFEPRSLTAGRAFMAERYRAAFAAADRALFAPVFHAGRLADDERLDLDRLVAELAQDGVEAEAAANIDTLLDELVRSSRPGDVVVTMSSGDFAALPHRLAERLRTG